MALLISLSHVGRGGGVEDSTSCHFSQGFLSFPTFSITLFNFSVQEIDQRLKRFFFGVVSTLEPS